MQTCDYLENLTIQLREGFQKIILDKLEFKEGDTIQITYTANDRYYRYSGKPVSITSKIIKVEKIFCTYLSETYCCINVQGTQISSKTKNPFYELRIEYIDRNKVIRFYSDYEILKIETI